LFGSGLSDRDGLDGFHAIAEVAKIIERLDFHRLRGLGNFDDEDLVFVLLHSFVDVCEVDEVIFRDQGIITLVFVVDGNRPSFTHRNFPQNCSMRHFGSGLSLFNCGSGTGNGQGRQIRKKIANESP
jgi:hypothetical protein